MTHTSKYQTGISITREEKTIVDEYQKQTGISFSSTLGMIIREWASMKADLVTIPKAGIIIKDGKVELDPTYWKTSEGVDQTR